MVLASKKARGMERRRESPWARVTQAKGLSAFQTRTIQEALAHVRDLVVEIGENLVDLPVEQTQFDLILRGRPAAPFARGRAASP